MFYQKENKELKRFCRRCGKELESIEILIGYNCYSGEKTYELLWICPERKNAKGFVAKWNGAFHDKYKSDENGSTYSYEC